MPSKLDHYLAERVESKAADLFQARNDRPQLEASFLYRSAASDNSSSLGISPTVHINSAEELEKAQSVRVPHDVSTMVNVPLTRKIILMTTGEQQRMRPDIYDSPPTILDNPEHLSQALPGASGNAPCISSYLALDPDVWKTNRGE